MWRVPLSTPAPLLLRYITDPQGHRYTVHLTPRERRGALGVHPHLKSLCFETEQGLWIGSLSVHPDTSLEDFSLRALLLLLTRVRGDRARGSWPDCDPGAGDSSCL